MASPSTSEKSPSDEVTEAASAVAPDRGPRGARLKVLSPANASALYLLAVIVLVFSLWVPETFLTSTTLRTVLAGEAVTALVALGLLVAVAGGSFDLSIGAAVGIAGIVVSKLMVENGWAIVPAIACALVCGVLIGAVNGLLVVRFRIDSFIATLGVSSILTALTLWISDSRQITGLSTGFQDLATNELLGVAYPVYYVLVLAVVLWFVLEHTPRGRYLYATGAGREAARLAGVRTNRFVFGSLVTSGLIAAVAGVVVTARISAGSNDVGPTYLLPAFAAVFFGATQLRRGRYNVWGTVLAVYVLATGVKGLELVGAAFWVKDIFNGAALIIAVGFAMHQRRRFGAGRVRSWRRLRPAMSAANAKGA